MPSPSLYRPRPQRWLTWRFSLRTLFVLVTLLCVWLGVQVKWIRDRHEAIGWMKRQVFPAPEYVAVPSPPVDAPWLIRFLGEPGVSKIVIRQWDGLPSQGNADALLRELKPLFPEAQLIVELQKPPAR